MRRIDDGATDEDYESEVEEVGSGAPYESVDPTVPYDFEQVARAA